MKINMFVTSWCPYCRKAYRIMDELKAENPEFADVEVEIIDEELQPEIAEKYDYYLVPTFFVGDEKVHEGVPTKEIIKTVYEKAIKTN